MSTTTQQHQTLLRRKRRTRAALSGSMELPRLSVSRSLRHISAQIIDDKKGVTLVSAHDIQLDAKLAKAHKTEKAAAVGAKLAELATGAKIKAVRFDRGAYKYHGRVAALADAARKGGLKF
ncbi:MAG: 50S ribosomal protein L18 [bacterium]